MVTKDEWEDLPVTPAQAAESEWEDLPPTPSLGERALSGLGEVATKIDSYTGAPARAAIGALEDGKGLGGSFEALKNQWGEDPARAPTARQLREKAGIDLGDQPLLDEKSGLGQVFKHGPMGYLATHVSPNEAADVGIDMAADLTNAVPLMGPVKSAMGVGLKGSEGALKGFKSVAGGASKRAEQVAKKIGRKFLERGLGADPQAIDYYLKNYERLKGIENAQSGITALKDDIDSVLEPLSQRVDQAKGAVMSAKERRAEELMRLADQRREAQQALRLAEEQRLGEVAAKMSGGVNQLNKDVSAGSGRAFEILDEEGVRVPLKDLKRDLKGGIKALKERALTDEEVAAADLLQRYYDRLKTFGPDMPGGEAKRKLQSLDREIKSVAPGTAGRLSREDQLLSKLRRRIDEPLKESSAYAEQMKKVADDTRLLMDAEGMMTESGAARALQSAKRATGKDSAKIIELLGQRQGEDYLAAVDRASLPEYQKLHGLLSRYRLARKGPELKAAKAELDAALSEIAPFQDIAPNQYGKSGSEALVRNQLRPTTAAIDKARQIEQLDQKFGTNFKQRVDDVRNIASFEKGYANGSANTNVWSVLMGSLGAAVGGAPGAVIGAASGAGTGRFLVDKFGPGAARAILDQVPKLKGMSPTNWINSLEVPEAVKQTLRSDLVADSIANATRVGVQTSKRLKSDQKASRPIQ